MGFNTVLKMIEIQTNDEHPDEWNDMLRQARKILRRESGLSFRDMDDAEDFRVFIYAVDFRCPSLVVNGEYNFAMSFDPETMIFSQPSCICLARSEFECACKIP